MANNKNVALENNQLGWNLTNQSFSLPGDRRWEGREAENEDVLQGEYEEEALAEEAEFDRQCPGWRTS